MLIASPIFFRRILKQTIDAVDREQSVQEAHTLYQSMKQFMVKLPNHSIKGKLNNVKIALASEKRKLKSMAAEMVANQRDCKSKEMELEQFKRTLIETKQELLHEVYSLHII